MSDFTTGDTLDSPTIPTLDSAGNEEATMAGQPKPTERKDVVIQAPVLTGRIIIGYDNPPPKPAKED